MRFETFVPQFGRIWKIQDLIQLWLVATSCPGCPANGRHSAGKLGRGAGEAQEEGGRLSLREEGGVSAVSAVSSQ